MRCDIKPIKKWYKFIFIYTGCFLISLLFLWVYYTCRVYASALLKLEEQLPWNGKIIIASIGMIFGAPVAIITLKEKFFHKNADIKNEPSQPQNDDEQETQKMLVEGAKLLGDSKSEAQKIVGLGLFMKIIVKKSGFAPQIIDILKNFIMMHKCQIDEALPEYKIFDANLPEHETAFQALSVIEKHGEIQNKLIPFTKVAIKGRKDTMHFHWLENIVWFDTEIRHETVSDRAIFVNCVFNKCVINEPAMIGWGNVFQGVTFNAFDLKDVGKPHKAQSFLRSGLPIKRLNENTVVKDCFFNPKTITDDMIIELERLMVKPKND